MEERKPNKLWSLVNHFFKSRYINTMLTLEGTWISALKGTCPLFLWHLTQLGGLTLSSRLGFMLSI